MISVRGARVHNLKNVDVDIPRNKLVVITGLSGSGKSSLAFDTVYAEGQRRYVESLSAYARQFLGIMDKPDVEQITGLSPAISIDQKSASRNPRSTVGTITEVYDYLRLLYARVGIPHCPECGKPVHKQTHEQILNAILEYPKGTKFLLLSPLVRDKKGEHKNALVGISRSGYARVRFDGDVYPIEEAMDLDIDKQRKHTLEVVVDRVQLEGTSADKARLADSLETALDLGNGLITLHFPDEKDPKKQDRLFSEHFACAECGVSLSELEPRNFSFNSPHGACQKCSGLGTKLEVDPDLVIPNKKLSVAEGAIRPWSSTTSGRTLWYERVLEAVATEEQFDVRAPVKDLSAKALKVVLYGSGKKVYTIEGTDTHGRHRVFSTTFEGVINNLERRYKETDSDYIRKEIERYMRIHECPECEGKRLRPEALSVLVGGKDIATVTSLPVDEAVKFFGGSHKDSLKLTAQEKKIGAQILKEVVARLTFLTDVGLSYLTLDRSANTLSGGEAQRIRLATQIGSGLTGVVYILDEPSIGLHQRDNDRLIATLKHLRDLGNTVIVVEHDEATIEEADWVIDVGPGAGKHGGNIIAQGTPAQLKKDPNSVTGAFLSGAEAIPVRPEAELRKGNGKALVVKGAEEHSLRNVDVAFPLGTLLCVTGVSGSGKSTLVDDILGKALAAHFHGAKDLPGKHKEIQGLEHLDKVIRIDQSPIGRTPRSNAATYTGAFTPIRELFASTPEAKMRGYKSGRFSFNVKGGRCEACQGDGLVRIEMHFLPDVYVECEECKGQRYNRQALEIHYKGKTISDVLHMTVEEAVQFFDALPTIQKRLDTLMQVGLGYIELGQSATTLSGGEAQRIKLATELSRRATGRTLYILDEPTTGLHFEDIRKLLSVLNSLTDAGNSVLVIEHNLDVIKSADWLIDMGPEGGSGGGVVVAEGTPYDVASVSKSHTGTYLAPLLKK
ncbi:MAG: excinuclease ABC subunit UvrA [Candidatus Doudnabacteria bacterium]|nr:excinuclease ABC subunit UvrA [Candidatus Doudnabacteria bacterium]